MQPIYLDYAATTPVDPQVAEHMAKHLTLDGIFANPASRSHRYGWQAEEAVEKARRQVADAIGAEPREVVWTSGATESDNLAIKGIASAHGDKGKHIITSAIEHKAVLDSCTFLEELGFEVTYIRPDHTGVISVAQVHQALRDDTILVSIMHVNNELGTVNPIREIGELLSRHNAYFHVDAAQSVGKVAVCVNEFKVDLLSCCAHKVYGPKGIGALYVRRKPFVALDPLIHGGGHERGMRSGTLPTHQITGMGLAFEIAVANLDSEYERLLSLRTQLLDALADVEAIQVNGCLENRVAGVLNLSVGYVEGETLLMALKDLALSSGSACTSAAVEPSYVLKAIGLTDGLAMSSMRISMGRFTTAEEVQKAADLIRETVARLRRVSPAWQAFKAASA